MAEVGALNDRFGRRGLCGLMVRQPRLSPGPRTQTSKHPARSRAIVQLPSTRGLWPCMVEALVVVANRPVNAVRNAPAPTVEAINGAGEAMVRPRGFEKQIAALGAGGFGFGVRLDVEELPRIPLRNHLSVESLKLQYSRVGARAARLSPVREAWTAAGVSRVLCCRGSHRRFGLSAAAGANATRPTLHSNRHRARSVARFASPGRAGPCRRNRLRFAKASATTRAQRRPWRSGCLRSAPTRSRPTKRERRQRSGCGFVRPYGQHAAISKFVRRR